MRLPLGPKGPGGRRGPDSDRGPGRGPGSQDRGFDGGPPGERDFAGEPDRFDPRRADDDFATDGLNPPRSPNLDSDDEGPRSGPRFSRGARLARFEGDGEDRN
jgi:hypothetical protein